MGHGTYLNKIIVLNGKLKKHPNRINGHRRRGQLVNPSTDCLLMFILLLSSMSLSNFDGVFSFLPRITSSFDPVIIFSWRIKGRIRSLLISRLTYIPKYIIGCCCVNMYIYIYILYTEREGEIHHTCTDITPYTTSIYAADDDTRF
jgi:hypothetical protein